VFSGGVSGSGPLLLTNVPKALKELQTNEKKERKDRKRRKGVPSALKKVRDREGWDRKKQKKPPEATKKRKNRQRKSTDPGNERKKAGQRATPRFPALKREKIEYRYPRSPYSGAQAARTQVPWKSSA